MAGGAQGGEALKIDLGPTYYLFYVKKSSVEKDPVPLALSKATMSLYTSFSDEQLMSFDVPTKNSNSDVWLGFCYNGLLGPAGVVPLYETRRGDEGDLLSRCEGWYGALDFTNTGEMEAAGNEVIFDVKLP
jgi:hypothetical protein